MGKDESWGVTCIWTGIQSGGNRNIFSRLMMPTKPDINTGLMSHIGFGQTMTDLTLLPPCHLKWAGFVLYVTSLAIFFKEMKRRMFHYDSSFLFRLGAFLNPLKCDCRRRCSRHYSSAECRPQNCRTNITTVFFLIGSIFKFYEM